MRRITLLAFALAATAILAACSSGDTSALTAKPWQLTGITEKSPAFQGVIPAADQSKYVVKFNTDGTVEIGRAACRERV